MPRNVEIKARVVDPERLETKVREITNGDPSLIEQDDTFFNCETGRLKLRKFSEAQGELIFYRRADDSGPKESFYVISRTAEPDSLRETLELAYGSSGRVIKRRLLYFVGRTRIHLDRVQNLGDFLELEVVLEDHELPDHGVTEARRILAQLDVEDAQLIQGAYVDLLMQN